MRDAGIAVDVADDPRARALIERFRWTIAHDRPYVTLKMAASLDGYVASRPGEQQWLTGALARERVRDLRIEHDAVMVGAGTVRVDDPQLTVRPHATRRKPYARVVVCETDAIPADSRVLSPPADAPLGAYRAHHRARAGAARGARSRALEPLCDVVYVGAADATQLDLARRCVRCATATSRPSSARAVPRSPAGSWLPGWFSASSGSSPRPSCARPAVPALAGADLSGPNGWRFDRIERVGDDMLLSADLTTCSPA